MVTDVSALTRHTGSHVAGLVPVLAPQAEPFFKMELLTPGTDVPAGFAVAVVLSGAGELTSTHAEPVDLEKGQTLRPGTTWPPQRVPSTTKQEGSQ